MTQEPDEFLPQKDWSPEKRHFNTYTNEEFENLEIGDLPEDLDESTVPEQLPLMFEPDPQNIDERKAAPVLKKVFIRKIGSDLDTYIVERSVIEQNKKNYVFGDSYFDDAQSVPCPLDTIYPKHDCHETAAEAFEGRLKGIQIGIDGLIRGRANMDTFIPEEAERLKRNIAMVERLEQEKTNDNQSKIYQAY
jgi:hypothetical protein